MREINIVLTNVAPYKIGQPKFNPYGGTYSPILFFSVKAIVGFNFLQHIFLQSPHQVDIKNLVKS
jgi:hypothetical protein